MNDLALFPPLAVEDQVFLNLKAEQIRAVAANAVIEIGKHLIEARERVAEGQFLNWLRDEFKEWKQSTAYNYMAVAERLPNFQGLGNVTREALYLLAGPSVPEPARAAAIAEAENGNNRITKKRADELIAEARQAAFAEAVAQYRSDLEQHVDEAVRAATTELNQDREALQAKIEQIHNEAANLPGISAALCHMLGQNKLMPDQCRNLAQLLDTSISVAGVTYAPISKAREKQIEEHLTIASAVTRALETLAGAPPAAIFADAAWPVQRSQHHRVCRTVLAWLNDYADLLDREDA